MNNNTTSTEIESASFAILANASLPSPYKHISVEWTDICHDAPTFVIKYDRFKKNKWIVKRYRRRIFSHDFAYVSSARSLASAIRFIENFNKEA